jgi:hypothetical protein
MRRNGRLYLCVFCIAAMSLAVVVESQQAPDAAAYRERSRQFSANMEKTGLAQPFKGITTNGTIQPGLFDVRSTGVPTAPVRTAADALLAALTPDQRKAILFRIDDEEWRKWANPHIYFRQGVSFEEMTDAQRAAATGLLRASLSAKGLTLTRDIMRLNTTLAELNNNNFVEYGEHKYWLTIMGQPSATEPWGWQLDGHHLNVNYFVLADQVVMTPAFWGSEPTVAKAGRYAGTMILQDEQNKGLALIRALSPEQQRQAIVEPTKKGNNILAQAFSDNIVLDYAGIKVSSLSAAQKRMLVDLIGLYVGNLRDGHAKVHLADVEKRLDDTYFAWIGGTDDTSVYYYRIHSPVVLIEFDHETPVGLRHINPPGVPNREHVHAVVRTPNGNDYGKDLLRLHYQQHPH